MAGEFGVGLLFAEMLTQFFNIIVNIYHPSRGCRVRGSPNWVVVPYTVQYVCLLKQWMLSQPIPVDDARC